MKVLWVVNVKLPFIYEIQGETNVMHGGGWLDRISRGLLEEKNIELFVCYPYNKSEYGSVNNLYYRGLSYNGKSMRLGKLDDAAGVKQAKKIIREYKPDVIHIHGTEFQYHWFFAQAAQILGVHGKLIVSIQGLVSVYAKHFDLGLPKSVRNAATPYELFSKKNVSAGIENFVRRGKYEEETIKLTNYVMGRTTWDRACTYRLNPKAKYYVGNETLRETFYEGNWQQNRCVPHRIFISQASYPVKGFHLFIDALVDIRRFYPDVTVHIAGKDLSRGDYIHGSSYGIYIKRLLKKHGLESCIKFCGSLNEEQMKREMLEANVFVSPSTIENSPNSMGEAMLLGVPVVSSGVGGVMDLLKNGEEGFIYQSDAPYMLAYYIMQIFSDMNRAEMMGRKAKQHAQRTHNYQDNLNNLIKIYEIVKEG